MSWTLIILRLIFALSLFWLTGMMLIDTMEMRSRRLNCEGVYQYSDECQNKTIKYDYRLDPSSLRLEKHG